MDDLVFFCIYKFRTNICTRLELCTRIKIHDKNWRGAKNKEKETGERGR